MAIVSQAAPVHARPPATLARAATIPPLFPDLPGAVRASAAAVSSALIDAPRVPRELTASFVHSTENSHKIKGFRPTRYSERKAISRLLDSEKATGTGQKPPGYSAIGCGVWSIHGHGSEVPHNATPAASFLSGRFRCNTLHCPHCASLKAADYRGFMRSVIFPAMEAQGLTGDLLTFTLAHSMRSDWTATRKALTAAFSHMHNRLRRLFKRLGVVGFIKSLEAPVGSHGIHPHYHLLLVRPRTLTAQELEELETAIRLQWEQSLRAYGGSCNAHGFDYKPDCVNDYLAKVTASFEVAAHDTKKAKKSGRTFVQLLHDYMQGDRTAGVHFLRWSAAMTGSKRFDTQSLCKALGVCSFVDWKAQQKEQSTKQQEEFDSMRDAEKMTLNIAQDVVNVLANSPVRDYYPFVLKYGQRIARGLTAENKALKLRQWRSVFDRCLSEHRRYMSMRPHINMTPERVCKVMDLVYSRELLPSEVAEYYAARILHYRKPAQINKLRRVFQHFENSE